MELSKQPALSAVHHVETSWIDAYQSQSTENPSYTTATTADGGVLNLKAAKILESRELSLDTISRLGWFSTSKGGSGEWIAIPYQKNGKIVNTKYRTISGEKKFYQESGAEKCFYNLDALKAAETSGEPLIICEGEMDCVAALQCGYLAISVPDGAPSSVVGDRESVKYSYLDGFPKSIRQIILAVDSDEAGNRLFIDLANRLGKHRCKFVKYPKDCKDLNDALMKYGERAIHETIKRAQFIKMDGLYAYDQLPPLPSYPSFDVGIDGLETHLRLRRGDFSIVTGIPSHGKSTFVNNVMANMAMNHGWHITFASFEQPPQTEHTRALRTLHCKVAIEWQTKQLHEKADEWINKHFAFIVPDDDSEEQADLAWLLQRAAAAVTRFNTDIIVIDPWNEIEHGYSQREMSETQYIGFAIRELKKFARSYQVHVMVVAHPTKMQRDKDTKKPLMPTLYDISGSANWYNKAEQGIIVHRDGNDTIINIAKSRYHNILGKPSEVRLSFSEYTLRYGNNERGSV